jgi:hypothetical protein
MSEDEAGAREPTTTQHINTAQMTRISARRRAARVVSVIPADRA